MRPLNIRVWSNPCLIKTSSRVFLRLAGKGPRVSDGTRTVLKLNDKKLETDESKPRFLSISGDTVEIAFRFPAEAIIGRWAINLQLTFKAGKKQKPKKFWHRLANPYILFNPWCKGEEGVGWGGVGW